MLGFWLRAELGAGMVLEMESCIAELGTALVADGQDNGALVRIVGTSLPSSHLAAESGPERAQHLAGLSPPRTRKTSANHLNQMAPFKRA